MAVSLASALRTLDRCVDGALVAYGESRSMGFSSCTVGSYGDRLSLDAFNGPDDGCSRKVISRNVIDERGDGCFRWTWRWLQRRMPRWYDYVGDVLVGNAESLCPSLVARSPSCSS